MTECEIRQTTSRVRLINAQLRYYYKMSQKEIDELSDEQWAVFYNDLEWIRKKEKNESLTKGK